MIIDFHTHCFPDELAGRAIPELSARAGIPAMLNGTINDLEKSMKVAKIDKSVMLPIATKPSQTVKINDWAASVQSNSIISFGSIHPKFENWKQEIQRIKELGLKGVKFHPDYQDFFVDNEEMFPMYDMILNSGLVIIFHAGIDIGLKPPYHCMPSMLKKVIRHFKGGKIVAAHMGGYDCYDEVERHLLGEDIYFDTSYCISEIGEEKAARLIRGHGINKVLFGTDSPWKGQAEEVALINKVGLDDSEKAALLGLNACRLLGLD